MAAFIIDAPYPNHRLLHASLRPPEKPKHDELIEFEHLAVQGLEVVLNRIESPTTKHLQSQLEILTIDPDEAMERVDTGEFWVGFGSREPVVNLEDMRAIARHMHYEIAQDFARLNYRMFPSAFEDEAFARLQERTRAGYITEMEAGTIMNLYHSMFGDGVQMSLDI